MYLLAPFILQNLYKKIIELIQCYENVCHFWDQNSPFVLNNIFWGINHCYYFHLPMDLFIVQNLKEVLQWIQNYNDAPFLGPKWSIYLKYFFFRKPVNEPCFFYSCLSTCQKSKSDINLLVKYWWFKNTKISLVESHFCLYLRTRFFPNMQFFQDVNEP